MIISSLSYQERAAFCQSMVGKRLLQLMDAKKTNLAFSADVTSADHLIALADQLGPEIAVLKTHIDIIQDFTSSLTKRLIELASKHHFLIFEDRKFADIGHTVKLQYGDGIYRIADWADITNAHTLPGPGIIQGLAEVGRDKHRGLALLAEMSSAGNLMDADYIKKTFEMAKQYPDFVFGFITQHAITSEPQWINLTPGVKLSSGKDTLGQQYTTPQQAIMENGADIIIVGRGIIEAEDPLAETKRYRASGWDAYQKRITSTSSIV